MVAILGDITDNLVNNYLSTSAFESDVRKVPPGTGALEASFLEVVNRVSKDIGTDLSVGSGSVGDMLKKLGSGVAAHYALLGGAYAAGLITEGAAAAGAGPVGALAAVAVEQAISEAVNSFIGTAEVAYAIGDWVQIDNGTKTVDVKTKHLGQAQFGEMFGDFQDDLQWDLETQEDYSSGFVCDTGPSKGHITVYNFKHNREQTIDIAFVRPVSPGLRAAFDGDVLLSAIRDLRLGLDELEGAPLLDSPVNTDPGTEVYLKGVRHSIVQCVGSAALIEDDAGNTKLTRVSDLTSGDVTHKRAYNYRHDGTVADGGFSTAGEGAVALGQYVWVRPGPKALGRYSKCQVELACVTRLGRGDAIVVATALYGEHVVEPFGDVVPVNEDIREMLNNEQAFVRFREACVTGYAVKRKAPGNWHPDLCLGVGVLGEMTRGIKFPQRDPDSGSGEAGATRLGFATKGFGPKTLEGEAAGEDLKEEFTDQGVRADIADDLIEGGRTPGEVGENNGAASYMLPVAIMVGAGIVLYVCCR